MTNRTSPVRRHSRFPVSWPVLYGNDTFLAEGTVLDLTALGWRVAGSVPVAPGMQLTLKVSVPDRSTPLCVHRATVLWIHNHEFAIEAHEMAPIDQTWVTEFLQQKLGLMWMSRITNQETSLHAGDEAPCNETVLPQPSIPAVEDILRQLLAIETAADGLAEPRWDSHLGFLETETDTLCNRTPEKMLSKARRILHGMVSMKAARERTGWGPIADN